MPRQRYNVIHRGYPQFMTSSIIRWVPVLRQEACARAILDSMRYLQDEGAMVLHAYVVMEDHFHCLASGPDIPAAMRRLLSHTARRVLKMLASNGDHNALSVFASAAERNRSHKLWRRGYHPKATRTIAVFEQKRDYIHCNPVRKGLVEKPEDWPYSSARLRLRDDSLPTVEPFVF